MRVSRILHAGYIFESADTKITFDPIFESPFSQNCSAFPAVEFDRAQTRALQLNAVFISHYHDDHFSLESLNDLDRQTPIFMYTVFDEHLDLIRELGFTNVGRLETNVSVAVGNFVVTPLLALDADVDSIFLIQAENLNVLNVVDAWIDPATLSRLSLVKQWDLVLWPFQTMRELEILSPTRYVMAPAEIPEESVEMLMSLRPRYLVPSSCQFKFESWSWANDVFFPVSYAFFASTLKVFLPTTLVQKMNPGSSFILSESGFVASDGLTWVTPLEDLDGDYTFTPSVQAPLTSDIAQKFNQLDPEQLEVVHTYLQSTFAETFAKLDASESPYFAKPLLYRLSLYDQTGKARHYDYEVRGNELKLLTAPSKLELAWSTEVIASKLYAALELGESLTSLYLRINACPLSPRAEATLAGVECLEDPLVRSLYAHDIASYQRAQLKRIKTMLE